MTVINTLGRYRSAIVLVVVVAIWLAVAAGQPVALNLAILIGIYGLMATSLGMVYGQAGMMSLCQASFAALGAYSTAILTTRWGIHPLLGFVAAALVPTVVAYPFARLIVRLSPLALALATLFLGKTIYIVLNQGGDLTGGYLGIGGIPPLPLASTPFSFAILVWGCIAVAVILYTNLIHSAAGRALNTLRIDSTRAQADGDRGPHRLSMIFAFAAGLAGVGGWLYAHYMTYLAPASFSMHLSLTLLLMVLVGGSRSVLGPVLGAALLTYLTDKLPDDMQGLFYGCAVVLVLIIAPRGVLGTVDSLWRRFRRERTGTRNTGTRGGATAPSKQRRDKKEVYEP